MAVGRLRGGGREAGTSIQQDGGLVLDGGTGGHKWMGWRGALEAELPGLADGAYEGEGWERVGSRGGFLGLGSEMQQTHCCVPGLFQKPGLAVSKAVQ